MDFHYHEFHPLSCQIVWSIFADAARAAVIFGGPPGGVGVPAGGAAGGGGAPAAGAAGAPVTLAQLQAFQLPITQGVNLQLQGINTQLQVRV